jgi:hypothetical protein
VRGNAQRHSLKHRLRVLRQVAARKLRGLPPITPAFFSVQSGQVAWALVREGLLAMRPNGLALSITATGKRFIIAHSTASRARHKSTIRAQPKTQRQPQLPGHRTPFTLPASFKIIAGPGAGMVVR